MRQRNATTLVALSLVALVLAGCGDDSDEGDSNGDVDAGPPTEAVSGPLPDHGDLLFVLRGPATTTDSSIAIDTDTVEWFTDLPKRRAGIARADELARNWKSFGFADTPPNAALAGADADAVVELEGPEVTSDGIAFEFAAIRGEVDPAQDQQLTVFVDSSEGSVGGQVTNNDNINQGVAAYLQWDGPESTSVSTDSKGNYEIKQIKQGNYEVTVSASGYDTHVFDDVGVGSASGQDFSLDPASSGGGGGGGGGFHGPVAEPPEKPGCAAPEGRENIVC